MAERSFRTIIIEELDAMYDWADGRDERFVVLQAVLLHDVLDDEPLTNEQLAEIGRLLGPTVQ